MYKILVSSILVFLSTIITAQTNNYFSVQTTVQNGVIEGNYDTKTGMQFYLGVPFAKPPIGQLRWKAPQPLENWKGVKQTKKFGPRAVQGIVFGDMKSRSEGLSEDCLYLNVWTNAKNNTANLPVLVYFFGGGFVAGDGAEPRYDGESMAKKGIVVVTVNYRLNIFGFFAHPELSAEAPYKASGNYGLLDQAAALKWVQQNIGAFGGNPKKVTIAGESAGSIAVSYQMASPLAKNLFAGAIGESGAGIKPTLSPVPLAEAEKEGVAFAKKAGYTSVAQLRKLSTKEVFEMYQESKRFGFPVVIDGYFLTATVPEIFAAKKQALVPLLAGWNSAEVPAGAFMYGAPPFTKEVYISRLKKEYPNDYETVLKLYPGDSEKQIELSATALASDRFIAYSTWKWCDLQIANSNQAVYRYMFSKIHPPLTDEQSTPGLAGGTVKKDANAPKQPAPVGASHASEIEYCMGNLPLMTDFIFSESDLAASATMQNYFANFIISGNPNGEKLPVWQAAKPGDNTPDIMIIDAVSKPEKAVNDDRYRFLDKAYGNIK
ncbi:MAG: Carboxylesterase [Ferruginibacter sp.]|uniref:carboxylesterase/lipase family protein n=1 Tax=Ferruginibacter sp. TaxID=1940288 RepID=UPI00265999EA|nr:carboxylesterase family protein [Ferruginibacter sp.]MDB5277044.1 Carboxylesterase [Ferruginibacter sp.]